MVIRIYKDTECVRYIAVDESVAIQLFNLILLHLGEGESVTLYFSDDEYEVVATGC